MQVDGGEIMKEILKSSVFWITSIVWGLSVALWARIFTEAFKHIVVYWK